LRYGGERRLGRCFEGVERALTRGFERVRRRDVGDRGLQRHCQHCVLGTKSEEGGWTRDLMRVVIQSER
jgi:hypothetical protein